MAISDAALVVAGLENPVAQCADAEAMFLADAENVGGLVIGWPVNMDGSEGQM